MQLAATDAFGDRLVVPIPETDNPGVRNLALYDLLATVLHELRAPLSSLTVTVELLLDNFDQLAPSETRSLLNRVQRSTAWLQALVDNLAIEAQLEVSQLQLRWSAVDLGESFEMARLIVQPSLDRERQTLVLNVADGAKVMGDPRRIEQVLVNLLINASRYGGPDTTLQVGYKPVGRRARIYVQDEGPGVPVEEQQRIFERYARGSSAAKGTAGLGLGLHIVRTLVELHGGVVGVDSVPGQGATFWFELPAVDANDAEPGVEWE